MCTSQHLHSHAIAIIGPTTLDTAKPKPDKKAKGSLAQSLDTQDVVDSCFGTASVTIHRPSEQIDTDYSVANAGRDTSSSNLTGHTYNVHFHRCQEKVSKRHENTPTYIKWGLRNKGYVSTKKFADFPWFREKDKENGPPKDHKSLEDIEYSEEWARKVAKKLYQSINITKNLSDDEFFVKGNLQNATGNASKPKTPPKTIPVRLTCCECKDSHNKILKTKTLCGELVHHGKCHCDHFKSCQRCRTLATEPCKDPKKAKEKKEILDTMWKLSKTEAEKVSQALNFQRQRTFIVDSGASFHMASRRSLSASEKKTIKSCAPLYSY